MKLYYSPTSPFVRKVLVVAHEVGLADRVENLSSAAHPVNRDPEIVGHNPLGQVPTFFTDEGAVLYDSRVVCEYLDTLAGGGLFPTAGAARWQSLTEQALGDGLLGAALLARYETVARPEEKSWSGWRDAQLDKVRSALAAFSARAGSLADRVDIGTITIACALSYLDLRFAELDWRAGRQELAEWYKTFAERPSLRATGLG
jgi:glutathione S-transferase